MKIGITERGDAGIDFSWQSKIRSGTVDGAVLITKCVSETFNEKVMDLYNDGFHNMIVHCTVTGWGDTKIEPNVCPYQEVLDSFLRLMQAGFPKEQCVLRIDPIIPSKAGLQRVVQVLRYADSIGMLPIRIRVSIYDEYPHVKQRLKQHGFSPLYGDGFQAGLEMLTDAAKTLAEMSEAYGILFESCAETRLVSVTEEIRIAKHIKNPVCIASGCISSKDLGLIGIHERVKGENNQMRNGCHCLSCKTELLNCKHQCPNQCLYCYWKD